MSRLSGERLPRKQNLKIWILFVIGILFSIYAALLPADTMLHWFDIDDGFFYFKVARNLNQGLGFTFDGINLTNGFHPLWMAVCVILYRIFPSDLILPLRVLIILAGVINALSGILLYRVLSSVLQQRVSFIIAGLWVTWPAIYKVTTTQGMETGLSLLLLLWLIDRAQVWFFPTEKVTAKRAVLFGLIALLAVFARLDHVFYVAVICAFAVFRVKLTHRALVFDLVGITVSVVLSYLFTYNFGEVNFSDHTIFPLLYLSLLLKPVFMWIAGAYRQRSRSVASWAKLIAGIFAANLALVPILYLINAFDFSIRFPKLVIILEFVLSTMFIVINHLLRELRSSRQDTSLPRVVSIDKTIFPAAIRVILPAAIGIGAYLIFNLRYFSTLLPVSGRIKHFWSTLDNTAYGRARDFFDVFGIGARINPWQSETVSLRSLTDGVLEKIGLYSGFNSRVVFSLTLVALLLLLILLLARARAGTLEKMAGVFLPALFIGSLFRVGFYAIYGYIGVRNWYWIVERLVLILLVAVLLDLIAQKLQKFRYARTGYALLLATLLLYSIIASFRFASTSFPVNWRDTQTQGMLSGVRILEELTPEGSLIGMTGGGVEGYFIRGRTIVNLDGLINSEAYYRSLTGGRAAEFLDGMGLDYVYGNIYMLEISEPYGDIFADRLELIHLETEEIGLYQYLPAP